MSETKKNIDKKGSRDMDEIAKTLFAPVYPVIAENIIRRFGISSGTCVDIGSGPASLAIAVARQSNLSVIALDYSDGMHEAASRNINEAGLAERIRPLCGDQQISSSAGAPCTSGTTSAPPSVKYTVY